MRTTVCVRIHLAYPTRKDDDYAKNMQRTRKKVAENSEGVDEYK